MSEYINRIFSTLSLCGLGALLLDKNNHILRVNRAGDLLLHGGGKLEGKTLPENLLGLLDTSEEASFCRIAYGEYVVRQPAEKFPEIPGDMQLIVFRDAYSDHRCALLEEVVSHLNEGVVISDEEGRLYYCNTAASRMDSIVAENELGERIEDIYQMTDGSECPLPRAIRERRPLLNYRQRYTTRHGKTVDAVANTWAILRHGDVLGAFNLLEDWSTVNELHRQIIDLRERLVSGAANDTYDPGAVSESIGAGFVSGASGPSAVSGPSGVSVTKAFSGASEKKERPEKSGNNVIPVTDTSRTRRPAKSPLTARYTFEDIICADKKMNKVVRQCRQVARTDSSVIIYGETGTGKELFAQSIHNASPRRDGPFLAINCAALPENLLESILFGSVKGAFTGAENRAGLFEQANHGTLLLDEINSMNISLQAKLLRVLQEGTVRRVGGTGEIRVDVRVLSCTNVPPHQAVAEGKMRQDLFYRLGVVGINIPPLRERKSDIPLLVSHFLADCNATMMRAVRGTDLFTMEIFQAYSWPGNVRELQHAIEHAINILPDSADIITPEYIPQNLLSDAEIEAAAASPASLTGRGGTGRGIQVIQGVHSSEQLESLDRQLQDMERRTLVAVLKENRGNISKSARVLRMSRQNLQYRIKRYGINVEDFR